MDELKNQVFANWSESAGFWDKHRSARQTMLQPVIPALCEAAGIPNTSVAKPYSILDIAAGPGDVSFALSGTLGPMATIWCTDFVPDMVKIAERTALEGGVQHVHFRQCRAEELPFDSESFDAVVCRFGIMFFGDPAQGLRESLRVLKPGSRVAHCVWGTRQANSFHHVVQDVLDRYVSGPAPDPDAPGAFRFAQPGKLLRVFEQADAHDVREEVFRFNIAAPLSFDQFFEVRTEMSDSLRSKLRKLPEAQHAAFKEDVRRNSAAYFSASGFSLPAEVLLVSGSSRRL